MNELDKIIQLLIKEKGGTKSDYLDLMDRISFQETGGARGIDTIQVGGGPGRGKYQFEMGDSQGGITAVNRLHRFYKENELTPPKWLSEAHKQKSFDASTLNSEQQDMLFLGYHKGHPRSDFSKIWNGEQTIKDFWLENHWAGLEKDRQNRSDSFDRNMEIYTPIKPKSTYTPIKPKSTYTPKTAVSGMKDAVDLDPNWVRSQMYKSVRDSRQPPYRENKDGTTSSHLMGQSDNFAYPTLFQEDNGDWTELAHKQAMKRAKGQGELYEFDTEQEADIFAKGSWKEGKVPTNTTPNAYGGNLELTTYNNDPNMFNEGGAHETNPYGGIPLGVGANGKTDTVEEGEGMYKFKNGSTMIFSNRIRYA